MDFNDSPQEAKFREEVRIWLSDNVPSAKEMEGLDSIEKAKLWQKENMMPDGLASGGLSSMEAEMPHRSSKLYGTRKNPNMILPKVSL